MVGLGRLYMHRINGRQRDHRHAVENLHSPSTVERRKTMFRAKPAILHYQPQLSRTVQRTVDEGVGNKGSA